MTKHFCDLCGKEIKPPSAINTRPVSNISEINPTTGQQTIQVLCQDCTGKMKDYVQGQQKINNIVPITDNLNLHFAKK